MFEVRCIVGDKKLSDVLRVLKGHTLEHPVVIPVDEAGMGHNVSQTEQASTQTSNPAKVKYKPRRRKVGGHHVKGKGAVQVVRDLINRTGAIRISAREMKRATMAAGYSPGAYSHAIKLLVADKTIRAISGTHGDYDVVRHTPDVVKITQASEVIQHG